MGIESRHIRGSLRFSLGHSTTQEDVAYALDALEEVVGKLRAMLPMPESCLEGESRS
jgi:cysteine sulfinate desulfinase/cysteine desulfurase-like protein